MKIALIGATGRTGRLLAPVLTSRGHQVSILVRDRARLADLADLPGLRIVDGDVTDPAALARLVEGADAVVSALGPTGKQPDLHTRTAGHLVAIMDGHGMRRFVGISGAGVDAPGDRKSGRDRAISFLINKLGGAVVKDKPAELAVWSASTLDWTLVRPPRLTDTPPTGDVEHHAHTSTRKTTISRADLAAFLADVVEQNLYVRQAPFAANA
ncbi:NAD(P)-binding oxidoreductase [Catellatospora sp. NPDC049609]|uniref:NAD(P)-dependent oxidoreductase n=1 Tax=Catellatospora sp. NPDC049609 TaxID=3155505 RepID=UPI0034121E6E